MTAEQTLKYWRDNLSCEAQVKKQLAEEMSNADTLEEMEFLNKIYILLYKNKM